MGCVNSKPMGFTVSTLYFVSFTVLGAFIELTLFIGAVTTGMDEAQDRAGRRRSLQARVDRITAECKLSASEVAAYRKVFNVMDTDNSGSIQEEEIMDALRAADRECELPSVTWWMIQAVDYFDDDDDVFDFPCFLKFMMERRSNPPPKSPEKEAERKPTFPLRSPSGVAMNTWVGPE